MKIKIVLLVAAGAGAMLVSCNKTPAPTTASVANNIEMVTADSMRALAAGNDDLRDWIIDSLKIHPDSICSCNDIKKKHPLAEIHVHQAELQTAASQTPASGKFILTKGADHEKICYIPFFNPRGKRLGVCDHVDRDPRKTKMVDVLINVGGQAKLAALAYVVPKGHPHPHSPSGHCTH